MYASIVVTPHFTYGSVTCDGPAKTYTYTINPTGQVDLPSDQVKCHGATTTVTYTTNNTVGTTTYTWTNDNTGIGLGATGTGNISFSATNTGTSPISGVIAVTPHFTYGSVTCDGPAKTYTITVNPLGQVNQPDNQVICNNTSTTTVTFATINTVGTTTYTWTNNHTDINLAASGTGDIISFTATNSGTSPVMASIVVTPHFSYGSVTCDGPTKTYTLSLIHI